MDPFFVDGNTCISFSGGRTSAYMLYRVLQANNGLPDSAKVLFCNTGKEEEKTLEFVARCGSEWGVEITWLEYDSSPKKWKMVTFETASRNGEPFEAIIEQRGGVLPNQVSRYCSSEMKTRTMHRFLRESGWTEWETLIGIRADEPRRVVKFRANPHPETKSEEVRMPLADAGIGKSDITTFWGNQSFDLELLNDGGITPAGNCDLCFLKPKSRIMSLIAEKPQRAVWWAKQEAKAMSDSRVTSNGCRFSIDGGYAAMAKVAEKQVDFIGHSDEETIPCFCGD
jgi:3'-phosphoadenosine 5'-phosphosulfate sulfotransferase (PAPS reductase)/FAD synthetase